MKNTIKLIFMQIMTVAFLGGMFGCGRTIPQGVTAVKNFDVNRYMGKWYEIARIDFKYEKNMNNTTAMYTLNDDGSVKVVNSGYDVVKEKDKQSKGKAKFVDATNVGMLKVSFFGPFYSGYNVIDLDEHYKYALVAGKNLDYLWILSREKTIPNAVRERFLEKAKSAGYDVSRLLWIRHDRN